MKLRCLLAISSSFLLAFAAGCATSSPPEEADRASAASSTTCTPEQQAALASMTSQPLRPPRWLAGLDLAGPGWSGLTLSGVEAQLCSGTFLGGTDDSVSYAWGEERELLLDFDRATGKVESYVLQAGYRGSLDFQSRPSAIDDPTAPNPFGNHTYSIGVGRPILRDGKPWELEWRTPCSEGATVCWEQQATELFDALMYTFAPDLPSTQRSCVQERTCLAKTFAGGEGVFGARPLGIYFYVSDASAPQPTASTPEFFYGFVTLRTAERAELDPIDGSELPR